jgi:hypothetical protein
MPDACLPAHPKLFAKNFCTRLGRAMRSGSRSLTLIVAILLSLLSPGFAAADCNPPWPSNSRWKLESRNGVSWLVTPCGERFLSVGINGLDEKLLVPPPDLRADKSWVSSHLDADSWARRTAQRMSAWGFNTVGGFSSADLPLPRIPELLLGWKSDFLWSDPFDPSAESRVMAAARELVAPYKDGGYRIGYFSDNEIGWWNGALFVFYIQKPATNYSKRKLVNLIRNCYGGNWRRFTADFVVPPALSSFDELLKSSDMPVRLRPGGSGINVIRRWTNLLAEHYYRFVQHALHEADRHALNFGDRLPIYYDPDAVRAMAPYVDVVATNYNVDSPDGWIAHYYFEGLRRLTGNKPVLVSEWFFCAQQNRSGNTNNGHLMTVGTQAERARGAANAARHFALIPSVVGIHWFQYYDEPKGGRRDGEDYDAGLVDTSDRPYEDLVAALSDANRNLVKLHQSAGSRSVANHSTTIDIPEADIDARERDLAQWPKDEALIGGVAAPPPEVPFGDLFLAWSAKGLHLATISQDYYDKDLLAYGEVFPLEEAFRIDLGIDAGAGPRRFAFFVVPPKQFPKKVAPQFRIEVCRMDRAACVHVPSAIATYFGSNQPRITAEMTLPWEAFGTSGPPRDRRLRLQLAATAFHRSRWMSLSGAAPEKAMQDSTSWKTATLTGRPRTSAQAK